MQVRTKAQTILVIDHDATVNDALRMLLSEVGYKAVAAPDLDAAVHLLSTLKVDLILSNYMESAYRRGDRWPVLEMIRLLSPHTPIIVLTTSPEEMNQSALQLGVADLISKPILFEDLLARVARAIDGRLK